MAAKIPVGELNPETLAKLGLEKKQVALKLVILGKVLVALEGLTTRDALWVLKQAADHVRGYRTRTTKPSKLTGS